MSNLPSLCLCLFCLHVCFNLLVCSFVKNCFLSISASFVSMFVLICLYVLMLNLAFFPLLLLFSQCLFNLLFYFCLNLLPFKSVSFSLFVCLDKVNDIDTTKRLLFRDLLIVKEVYLYRKYWAHFYGWQR